jgi:uncharacterized membrane protein
LVAARPIIDVDPSEDTGRRQRLAPPPLERLRPPPADPPPAWWRDRALGVVVGMAVVWSGVFAVLSVLRYRTFSTGRFDLGNMVQAVWSTTEGRFLDTTDVSGVQFNRLGAHVDPVLALFAPLWWIWSSPEMLLVVQALIVATGALPAFWLGRRWLGDDRLAVAGAAVYLLYPALQSATLFDFHPVTLAAPLLMFCIWAAEEGRCAVLAPCAVLAALTQEQVGLMLLGLAVWMGWRHPRRRRAAAVLGVGGLAWVVIALTVIMPAFALDGSNPHVSRYSALGDGPLDIALVFVTRPWEAVAVVATPGRAAYLVGLLLPLLLLPLAAPLLALAAAPQLLINLFASSGPVQTVEYHYGVVLVPFLVSATLLGLASLRDRGWPARLEPLLRRPPLMAGTVVAAVVVAGVFQGPLPLWGWLPGGYGGSALHRFTDDDQVRALREAVRLIPADARVSAANGAGSHLSARRRILLFPRIGNSEYALLADNRRFREMARDRPTLRPPGYRAAALRLAGSSRWEAIYDHEGVILYRRLPRELRSS